MKKKENKEKSKTSSPISKDWKDLPDKESGKSKRNKELSKPTKPELAIGKVVSLMAEVCGRFLRASDLYLKRDSLVTVDPKTAEIRSMDAVRFVSWVEKYVDFGRYVKSKEGKQFFAANSISVELAGKLLSSDQFREQVRVLNSCHDVVLPAWANEAQTKVRLLPPGYDDETGVFTAPMFEYDTNLDPNAAFHYLCEIYREFPFAEGRNLRDCRSFSVHLAAHFAAYCRLMLLDNPRLAFVYLANQQGGGKSLLGKMALAPVFGSPATSSLSKREEEVEKSIRALLKSGEPFAFFDNYKGFLGSAELEGLLTSKDRISRVLGTPENSRDRNNLIVVVTGNGVTLSPDMKRRSLICDLFCAENAVERKIENPIEDSWPTRPEIRAQFLAVLWSLLNEWQEAGAPRAKEKLIPSFEHFSGIIGGIIEGARFASPLTTPATQVDEVTAAWELLFQKLAEPFPLGEHQLTVDEVIEKANEIGVLEILTGGAKDERKSIGLRIKRWKGRVFRDALGRKVTFSKRRHNIGVRYTLTIEGAEPAQAKAA